MTNLYMKKKSEIKNATNANTTCVVNEKKKMKTKTTTNKT